MSYPKTKLESARELCLTYTSVGGGLLVALFIYTITSNTSIEIIFIIQLISSLIGFLRLYWFYINSVAFFSPFDSMLLLGIDLAAFLTGGMIIGFMGKKNIISWFFIASFCFFICSGRAYTISKERDKFMFSLRYPSSYKKMKKGSAIFAKSLALSGSVTFISGIISIVVYSYNLMLILCIILLFTLPFWFIWKEEMWPDDEDSRKLTGSRQH